METLRSPKPGSGEWLPSTRWPLTSIPPLPQRLAAGESFHSELSRTQSTLRGRSRTHAPIGKSDDGDARSRAARQHDTSDESTRHTERAERPNAKRSAPERATRASNEAPRHDAAVGAPEPASAPPCATGSSASSSAECGDAAAPNDERATRDELDASVALAPQAPTVALAPIEKPLDAQQASNAAPQAARAKNDGTPSAAPIAGASQRDPLARTPRAQRADAAEQRPDVDEKRAQDVLRQLRDVLGPSLQTATLQLEPHELGRLSIRLALHDGRLSAHVRAERPETLRILERHLPELQAALADKGIQAESFELELGSDARDPQSSAPASTQRRASGAESFETELSRANSRSNGHPESSLDTWA